MADRQVASATEGANDTVRIHHGGFCSRPPACSTLTCQLHRDPQCRARTCRCACVRVCVCVCASARSSLPQGQEEVEGGMYSEYRPPVAPVGVPLLHCSVREHGLMPCQSVVTVRRGACQLYTNLQPQGHKEGTIGHLSRTNLLLYRFASCVQTNDAAQTDAHSHRNQIYKEVV